MPKASVRSRSAVGKKRARKKTAASAKKVSAKKRAKRSVSSQRGSQSRATQSRPARSGRLQDIQDNEARFIGGGYSDEYRAGGPYGGQDGERRYRAAVRALQGRYEDEEGGHYARVTDRYGRDEENLSRGRYGEEDGGHYYSRGVARGRGRPSQHDYYGQRGYGSYDRDRRY